MKRKLIMITTLCILIIFSIGTISYAISPQVQANIAAQDSFKTMLKSINTEYRNFYFTTKDEVSMAKLGNPIQWATIDINKYDPSIKISDQVTREPFYTYPVIAGNNVITDFSIILKDEEWHVVDFGGALTKNIYKLASENNFNPDDCFLLNFGGDIFVIVNKNGEEMAFSPYYSDQNAGLKEKTLVNSDIIKKSFMNKVRNIQEKAKLGNYKTIGSNEALYGLPPLEFKQKGIFERLSIYFNHLL